jgi:hypothetical protein
MADEPKKTHAQLHKELMDAMTEVYLAKRAKDEKRVKAADAEVHRLAKMLPPPRGSKPRWKK